MYFNPTGAGLSGDVIKIHGDKIENLKHLRCLETLNVSGISSFVGKLIAPSGIDYKSSHFLRINLT